MTSSREEYDIFKSVPRELWANAEQRLFAGCKLGRKTQYKPADRTARLCLEIHKPPNASSGIVELNPLSNTGKIDKDKVLPFDVVAVFLHKSDRDIVRYVNNEGGLNHMCNSKSCANVCHISVDPERVIEDRKAKCSGKWHTATFNPACQCPHLPKCYFPFAD